MLKKIVLGLAALVVVLVVVVSMQPSEYRVERSEVVPASPEVVYGVVSDFSRFKEWSPWAELDPNMKVTVEGEPGTVGTKYHWVGNDDVGEGTMTITKVDANKRVDIALKFVQPFESESDTSYVLEPSGEGTKVAWVMDGKNNFMAKAFGMMMDMDTMIGKDFEKGLGKLSGVVKAEADEIAAAKKKAEEEAAAAAAAAEAGDGEVAEAAN